MAENNESKSSFGRNIFTEKHSGDSTILEHSEIQEDINLKSSQKTSLGSSVGATVDANKTKISTSTKKNSSVAAKGTASNISAIYATETYSMLVSTFYDGLCYTLTAVEVEPVEAPVVSDNNITKVNYSELVFKSQVESLKRLISKSGINIKETSFVTAVTSKGTVIKQILITDSEMKNIEAELPKLVVSSFENSAGHYEYLHLSSFMENEKLMHDVLVSCVDNRAFFNVQGLMSSAGINCTIMDVDIMAVANLFLESVAPKDDTVSCVVDIGTDSSNIIIYSATCQEALYVRSLDFTFNAFRKLISQNRECSLLDAEKIINERNFSEYFTKAFELETTENLNELYSVKNYLKRDLLTEMQRTFQYYNKKSNNRIPSVIYITGKALDMKNFAQFLVKNIDIKCEELDVSGFLMGNEMLKSKIEKHRSLLYKAVGLALRYE